MQPSDITACIRPAIAALVGFGIVYMLFAFAAWDFNPAVWGTFTRLLCATVGAANALIMVSIERNLP